MVTDNQKLGRFYSQERNMSMLDDKIG